MHYLFIINPSSGGLDKNSFRNHLQDVLFRYDLSNSILETRGDETDPDRILDSIKNDPPDRIAAIGGDGTVRLVALSTKGMGIPVGIIPMGSSNGIARELGLPADAREALSTFLISHHIQDVDLLHINGEPCLHFGDMGINAEMVRMSQERGERGMTGYAKQLTSILPGYEPFEVKVKTDGDQWEGTAYQVAIANARQLGTGVVFNPTGKVNDGKFEVVIIVDFSARGLLDAGISALNPEVDPDYGENLITLTATEAHVEVTPFQTLQLDGEPLERTGEIEATIEPSALTFIMEQHRKGT